MMDQDTRLGPKRVSVTVKLDSEVRDDIIRLTKNLKYLSISDFVVKAVYEKMVREKSGTGPLDEIAILLRSEEGQTLLNQLVVTILIKNATQGLQSHPATG